MYTYGFDILLVTIVIPTSCNSRQRIMWLFALFCTCIPTLRGSFLILNKFSCGKWKSLLFIWLLKEHLQVFMLCAVFFYTTSRKDFHTWLELVWKNTPCLKTIFIKWLMNRHGICTLQHKNSLNIKEVMINFLTHSNWICVQNITWFPHCDNWWERKA